jgi:hypothetical protein
MKAVFHFVITALSCALALSTTVNAAETAKPVLTDAEVKQQMIKESIQEYPGKCPCPYSTMSNGSRCGKRSAYLRPGGYSPLCYPGDVTEQMLAEWREAHTARQ